MGIDVDLLYDRFSLPARVTILMKRRDFLKKTMLLGAAGLALPVSSRLYAANAGYTGRLLILLQAEGGWDVTSFCDPKVNQPGEPEINHWSSNGSIQTAGNIAYAPFADNSNFFNKYYGDLLVINGVDAQTNSHSTGILHNWSGRNSEGFPSLSAMFAAQQAPDQALSYINCGGFAQTANLIRFSRLDDIGALRQLLKPEVESEGTTIRSTDDMTRIRAYRRSRVQRLIADPTNLPRLQYNLEAYAEALDNKSSLTNFADFIPSDDEIIEIEVVNNEVSSNLRRQIQMALSAFEAGISSAVDLHTFGYDTHVDHDTLHAPLYAHLVNSIDFLWTLAEQKGIADRITLVIGSDFGRTPNYNSDNGKDHWPIGSVLVMEQNPSWGNRVFGETDEGHNAYHINPSTLARDDSNGTIIYPKHVHKALRRYLGLENTAVDANFQFSNTEDFDFFG
ncbi:MAG TPA: DUF1501 domain-containing protein [Pseudomonadales bacterium]|nr:DUF1501 domain-containing protein [Pseudomonadales bacterium]